MDNVELHIPTDKNDQRSVKPCNRVIAETRLGGGTHRTRTTSR
jgi:hypothetical protein